MAGYLTLSGTLRTLCASFLDATGLRLRRCPICGETTDSPLCPQCTDTLRMTTTAFCPRCGKHVTTGEDAPLCSQCQATPPAWDALHFYGPYEGTLGELIKNYKFSGNLGIEAILGNLAAETATKIVHSPDIVIPVPLHKKRLRKRGFNQSTALAKAAAQQLGAPMDIHLLERIRYTQPQTELSGEERRVNLLDAFEGITAKLSGKSVLLVDDVCTTGSTLTECARALQQAGATHIEALVLARA